MAGEANSPIKVKKILEVNRKINRGKKGMEGEMFSLSLNKFNPGIIAEDVNVAVGIGGETAGERREMGESGGER